MNIDFSLESEPRGYYMCLHNNGEDATLFLANVTELLPYFNTECFPFSSIEDLIKEWVVHELIHKFTELKEDKIIDRWHIVLCHLLGGKTDCNCPIDCFWRSITEVKKRG